MRSSLLVRSLAPVLMAVIAVAWLPLWVAGGGWVEPGLFNGASTPLEAGASQRMTRLVVTGLPVAETAAALPVRSTDGFARNPLLHLPDLGPSGDSCWRAPPIDLGEY